MNETPEGIALHACPLCNSARIGFYLEIKGYRHDRCTDCGFAFLNPMPDQRRLNATYQGWRQINQAFYPHAGSRGRKSLLRGLRLWGYLRGKRVLDVGCGGGFFVNAARRLGAEATGLDVDTGSIAYARREFPACRFECMSYDNYRPERKFDFIHCSEVIEHVSNPHDLMKLFAATLAPGGHIFITTPDLGSPNLPANVADWAGFSPPVHVGLFTEGNLRQLFDQYGFALVKKFPIRKTGMKLLFQFRPRPAPKVE
ncbi:MAG TPA: class I SAM-dependent methyltransferase [Gammaproteobacteria bacterium]|nr:class I SAM-dependent methyltransferase [Gammaproteobacteria bacterium]